jgi:hypothetical protein
MLLITCGWGSNQQDKRKDRKIDGSPSQARNSLLRLVCQLLRAEFCRRLAFPGHSPAVRYSEVIVPVGCARSALGCSSAKRSRSRVRGDRPSISSKSQNPASATSGPFDVGRLTRAATRRGYSIRHPPVFCSQEHPKAEVLTKYHIRYNLNR